MITWSDGKTSTGISYLDQYKRQVEGYAIECENFAEGLWIVRVYVGPYFSLMSDYFRTEEETQEYMQFVRVFYIMMSMIAGLVLIYVGFEAANANSGSGAMIAGLANMIRGWGIIMFLTMMFMLVYFLL